MPERVCGAELIVDLAALKTNYTLLKHHFTGPECAGVVKANAYGLGVGPVAQALYNGGCRTYFVATLPEALELKAMLAGKGETKILVFHGSYAGEEQEFAANRLIPVINSPAQLARWLALPVPASFALHIDTGINRLGLTQAELADALERPGAALKNQCVLLLSHLACANDPQDPKNADQLARFREARAMLPNVPASLCNSSGIHLHTDFHFDLARPGCALYGINPTLSENPMRPVVTLTAPIMQIRTTDRDDTVGYGATCQVKKGTSLAIVQLGYADGYTRLLSNKGICYVGSHAAPIAGRVSMDMIVLDLSGVPESAYAQAAHVEILNARQTVDDVAEASSTIGYEVLTRIGARVRRRYVHAA